jgi:hypothetical protein
MKANAVMFHPSYSNGGSLGYARSGIVLPEGPVVKSENGANESMVRMATLLGLAALAAVLAVTVVVGNSGD